MAVLSALVLIRLLSIFHLTLAFYLLTAPQLLADQNLVFILGESVHLPPAHGFEKPTPVTAFLALTFTLLGLSDFTAASADELPALNYWGSQAPVRLLFFFGVAGHAYLFQEGGVLGRAAGARAAAAGPAALLRNGLVFAWAFVEVVLWFWVYVNVREERRVARARVVAERERGRE